MADELEQRQISEKQMYIKETGRRGSEWKSILHNLAAYHIFLMEFGPKKDRALGLLQLS